MINGLNQNTNDLIISIFKQNLEIEKAILFGSRAKGNFNDNSDIDLALIGINDKIQIEKIAQFLDELPTPYKFDLKSYDKIVSPELKNHIDRIGIVIYQK